jgi:signal transduction histidine kinase
MGTLKEYFADLMTVLDEYESVEQDLSEPARRRIDEVKRRLQLDYLRDDAKILLDESTDGIRRVTQIVQDLKDFSHVDEAQWLWSNLHKGLDSTLNIVHNEIKYVAKVVKEYGEIPEVECLASQINQVFMNLLVNAAHAMQDRRGHITIRTGMQGEEAVFVEITDQGCGIPEDNLRRIFDPFFTTKPVGKGTGLGLSLSYSIVKKHAGQIEVRSVINVGTTFRITLPCKRSSIGDS